MNNIPKYSIINFDDKVEVFKTNETITSVRIFDKIYNTIPEKEIINELKSSGYVRFIYFTLRHRKRDDKISTDEFFYVGQHGADNLNRVRSYFGSGRIIRNVTKVHPEEVEKCYLKICSSKEEMNRIENEIVDERLLSIKPYCLNLMKGGFSSSWKDGKTEEELMDISRRKSEGIRASIKSNPEWILKRNEKMTITKRNNENRERQREMFRVWRKNNPEKSKLANEKSSQTFKERYSKSVAMYDLDGNLIKSFKYLPDCGRYILNKLQLNLKIKVVNTAILKCINGKYLTAYGYQFKSYDKKIEYKTKPVYFQDSCIVYSNNWKPIYLFRSLSEFSDLVLPYIKKSKHDLMKIINQHISRITSYFNLNFKKIKKCSKEEIDYILSELKNSKKEDIFDYIDFSKTCKSRWDKS